MTSYLVKPSSTPVKHHKKALCHLVSAIELGARISTLPGYKKVSLSPHCGGAQDLSHNFSSQQVIRRPCPKYSVSGDLMESQGFHLHLKVTRCPSPTERYQRSRDSRESGFLQPASWNEAELCPLGASQVAQWLRICLPMQETNIWSLVREDPQEEEMATHSSIFAWKISEEPGGLQSVGSQRVKLYWATEHSVLLHKVSVKASWGWIIRHSFCYQPRSIIGVQWRSEITPPFYSDKTLPPTSFICQSTEGKRGAWTSNPAWQ